MKISLISLLALVGSVVCVPATNATDTAGLDDIQFKDISVPPSHIFHEEATVPPSNTVRDTTLEGAGHDITERGLPGLPYWGDNIYNNYQLGGRPLYNGWRVNMRNTYQFRFQGNSYEIPTDVNGATWLASTFSNSVNSLDHDQYVHGYRMQGGWCFDAQAYPGWRYSSIPRQMLNDWVLDHCATHAVWTFPQENTFQNAWHATTGEMLFYFRVYPCDHNGNTDHGETFDRPGQAPAPW
ncbi:hypothetical protein CONLIGDRAFT_676491 [Coniochaeta ligniaria NRRL 30616]|uniref:Uncharacterized protein n=1 Tax=Coniochaeta ligniaria NRRL 30616 TaxID=1408157 RepID=A0A1J7JQA1_9PEZI|nr:hypothetical protein CONLIGDRAFT_676491 [Coniochaeta ligniaria NRRL 30616]